MRPSNMSEARLLAEFSKNDNSSDPYGHQKSASGGSEESSDAAGSPSSQSKRTAPAPPALNLAPPVMIPHDFPPVEEAIQTATTIGADAEHARELWSDFMKSTVHMLEAFQSSKYEQVSAASSWITPSI